MTTILTEQENKTFLLRAVDHRRIPGACTAAHSGGAESCGCL